MTQTLTPWGETFEELALAILADPAAPPFLLLAAFRAKHGDDSRLRQLVSDAVALHEAESADAARVTG